jgi:hypothetical protein
LGTAFPHKDLIGRVIIPLREIPLGTCSRRWSAVDLVPGIRRTRAQGPRLSLELAISAARRSVPWITADAGLMNCRVPEAHSVGPDTHYEGPETYCDAPEPRYRGPGPYCDAPEPYCRGPEAHYGDPEAYCDGPDACYHDPEAHRRTTPRNRPNRQFRPMDRGGRADTGALVRKLWISVFGRFEIRMICVGTIPR